MGRAAEKSSASPPSAPSSAKFDAALPLRFFEVELAGLKKEKMFSFAVRAGRVYKNPMGRMGSCKVPVDEDWGVERPLAICGSLEAAAGPESLRDMAAGAGAADGKNGYFPAASARLFAFSGEACNLF